MFLILFLSTGTILIHLDENFILQTQENIIGVIFLKKKKTPGSVLTGDEELIKVEKDKTFGQL